MKTDLTSGAVHVGANNDPAAALWGRSSGAARGRPCRAGTALIERLWQSVYVL